MVISVSNLCAQHYCLELSKENKKSVLIERNKKISYLLTTHDEAEKGVITRISPETVFIQEEDSDRIVAYSLTDFRFIAYTTTARVVGGAALILVATTASILSSGDAVIDAGNGESTSGGIFQKNMDMEAGWVVQAVLCE